MTKIKICGITNLEDGLYAVDLGVDALGFVFYPQSERYLLPEAAKAIIDGLPPFINTVGVFVDEDERVVSEIAEYCGLDILQFHGGETPEYCELFRGKKIKAFRVKDGFNVRRLSDFGVDAYLLDTYSPKGYGGTGEAFNWKIAKRAKGYGRIILAGGLSPENVEEAITEVEPYAVDVSSGVESSPGKKDPENMRLFVERARKVWLQGHGVKD